MSMGYGATIVGAALLASATAFAQTTTAPNTPTTSSTTRHSESRRATSHTHRLRAEGVGLPKGTQHQEGRRTEYGHRGRR